MRDGAQRSKDFSRDVLVPFRIFLYANIIVEVIRKGLRPRLSARRFQVVATFISSQH